jgi:nitrate reductase / nitrite oxidoreductase, alpha subunit
VVNVLPRIEMIAVNEWWWTASCEWADVVFGVDSWAELKHPDMTARSPTRSSCLPAHAAEADLQHDRRHRVSRAGGVEAGRADRRPALQRLLEVRPRGPTDVYLQRILDHFSTNTKGYRFADLEPRPSRASRR